MQWNGSSKDVSTHKDGLRITFTDFVSVFDRGRIPAPFPGLGAIRCEVATHVFEALKKADIDTHFLRRDSETSIIVSAFDVPEKSRLFPEAQGRMLPLELLFRFQITKKFLGRIENGSVDRAVVEPLLGNHILALGARMNPPFIECSTKHKAGDTYLTDYEAAELAELTPLQLGGVYQSVGVITQFLKNLFRSAGFDLADGKLEGAIRYDDGSFVPIDSLSPDELRLIGPDGTSHDKDPVRNWYEVQQADWVRRLNEAKKKFSDKSLWPEYEAVPPAHVINTVVTRYGMVAEGLRAVA